MSRSNHLYIRFLLFLRLRLKYIDSDMAGSSLFLEYLEGLSRVTEAYVTVGKREALGYFLPSTIWAINEKPNKVSYSVVATVLSKTLALSASLIRKLETKPERHFDLLYIQFIAATQLEQCLKKYPRAFTRIEIDNLIFLMEKSDRLFIGELILLMPFIESDLKRLKTEENGLSYNIAISRYAKVISKLKEILKNHRYHVFLENNSLNIMNMNDRTIASIQLKGTLKDEEIPLLDEFIKRSRMGSE